MLGCSTEKNTFLSRAYHNFTAHYNTYFNAQIIYNEGIKDIQIHNKDYYTYTLPIFPDSKLELSTLAYSKMNRAIIKASQLIKNHSITEKPKRIQHNSLKRKIFYTKNEFNRWVNCAYLLIGKAHFIKGEYNEALHSFTHVLQESSLKTEQYEALLYMARSYIRSGDFIDAKYILNKYDLKNKTQHKLLTLYAAIYGDYYLQQQQYKKAIPFLKLATENTKSKYHRTRYTFILAQLYHKQKDLIKADSTYKKIIQTRNPYELIFNAKLNSLSMKLEEDDYSNTIAAIKNLLFDTRNRLYKDQIYYILGENYLKTKDDSIAIENFHLSINNRHQKGLSFYELAKIFCSKKQYTQAYHNSDSALQYLNKYYPDYNKLSLKYNVLSKLESNLNIITREDSLQRKIKSHATLFTNNILKPLLLKKNLDISDSKIKRALMTNGLIYKNKLKNISFAINTFNEMLKRFKDYSSTENILINLYKCYEELGDKSAMAKIKEHITQQFPNGSFATYLKDPDFFMKCKAIQEQVKIHDKHIYNNYLYNKHIGISSFKNKDSVIYRKKTSTTTKTNSIDPLIKKDTFKIDGGNINGYILFKKEHIDVNILLNLFKNYTHSTFNSKYKISSGVLNGAYFFICINGFPNKKEAVFYINKVKIDDFLMQDIEQTEHYIWIINDINLKLIRGKNSIKAYQQFYKHNY